MLAELNHKLSAFLHEMAQNPAATRGNVIQAADFSAPPHIFNEVVAGLGLRLQEVLKNSNAGELAATESVEPTPTRGLVTKFDLELHHRPGLAGKVHAINDAAGLAAQKVLSNDRVIGSLLTKGLIVFTVSAVAHIATSSTLATTAYYLSLPAAATLGRLLSVATAKKHLLFMKTIDAAVKRVNDFLHQRNRAERDQTMSLAACRILAENPEIPSLLIQVGKAHVPGIKKQLEEAGWRSEASARSELID